MLALALGASGAGQVDAGRTGAGPAGSPQVLHGITEAKGRHVRVRAGATHTTAAPGQRVTLVVDVTPTDGVHVYAPGQKGYMAVALKLDPSPAFRPGKARYPPPREFLFAPLQERVKVYDRPFRIQQDVTLALTPSLRKRAEAKGSLTISGRLDYQACDDAVCFRPDSVPLRWTIDLVPVER